MLLYELLTGTTPLDMEKLRGAAFVAMLLAIKEEEPKKPSTRLSASKDSLPSISAQRRMAEPAWQVALSPRAARADYEAALLLCEDREKARGADAVPARALLLHRLGRDGEALADLRRRLRPRTAHQVVSLFIATWSAAGWDPVPTYDLPAWAICLHGSGRQQEAKAWLQRARQFSRVEERPGGTNAQDYPQLLAEAEALIEGKPARK